MDEEENYNQDEKRWGERSRITFSASKQPLLRHAGFMKLEPAEFPCLNMEISLRIHILH